MAGPKITIEVAIKDTGDAAFARMKARFEELADVSDAAVSEIGKSLNEKLAGGFARGGEREYLETIRRLQPELRQLHQNLKDGAFDLVDYHRRMQMLDPATRSAIAAANQLGTAIRKTGHDAEHGTNGLGALLVKLDLLGRGVDFVKRKFGEGLQEFIQFGRNVANIGSIADDDFDLSKLREDLIALPPEFGRASDEARGFYQALSSGVSAADALQFTKDSAIAAKAGLTDLFTTVDASTTVLNSYGIAAGNVTNVYDLMFETVKRGKIEFPQLAQSIGQVSNIAAQGGVKIEELFAVIATATATTKPAVVMEAYRSALANIIKPSEQARDLARQLGLEFDVAALRSKGFAAFLADVMEKTEGNTDQLAILFGDVQGLNSILSITGAQSQNFTNNIDAMRQAFGSADPTLRAFNKQQESLGAQMDATGVMIEKGFLKAFRLIEPILIAVLSVITKYPTPLAVAAIAVGALTAAHVLYNTQLVVTASAGIPNLIKSLLTTIAVMYQMTAALITGSAAMSTFSATALVAFTAGWGLIAVAVGVAGYAIYKYVSAQRELANVTVEQVKATQQQISSYQESAKSLAGISAATADNAERQQRLKQIYDSLDSSSKNRVDQMTQEKGATGALTAEVQRLIAAKQQEQKLRFTDLLAQLVRAAEEAKNLEAALNSAEAAYTRAKDNGGMDIFGRGDMIGYGPVDFEELRTAQIRASEAAAEGRKKFEGVAESVRQAEQITGLAARTTAEHSARTRELSGNIGEALQRYDQYTGGLNTNTSAANANAQAVNGATAAVNAQTQALDNLKAAQDRISNNRQLVSATTIDIVENAKSGRDAQRQVRERLSNDPEFAQRLADARRQAANQKAVDEALFPSEKARTRTPKIKSEFDQLSDRLREINKDIASFRDTTSREFNLRIEVEEGERTMRDLEQIISLRRELGEQIDAPLPQTADAARVEIGRLEASKRALEEKGRTAEEVANQIEQLRAQTFELSTTNENGRTNLEKLNFYLFEQGNGAKYTKEQIENLTNATKGLDAAEAQRARNQRTKNVTESLDDIQRDLRLNISELQLGEPQNELSRVLDQVMGMKDFKLSRAAFDPLLELLRGMEGKEATAGLIADKVREILKAADIDPSRVNEVADAIARIVGDASKVDALNTSLARAQRGLQRQLKESQEEIGIASETAALRYQIAWQDAYNEVALADDRARVSQIQSQMRIADQTVFHAEQANARVLDFMAQQKSVSELIGDARVAVLQKSYDAIDALYARFTKRLGAIGDVVRDLLAGFTKLLLNKAFLILSGQGAGGAGFGFGGGAPQQGGGFGGIMQSLFGGGSGGASGSFTGGFAGGNPVADILRNIRQVSGNGGVGTPLALSDTITGGGGRFPTVTASISSINPANLPAALGGTLGLPGLFSGIGFGAKAGSGGVLAGMLPLLGLGLGAQLGGGKGLGGIIGGIGGGLLGIGLTATPAIFGAGGALAGFGGAAGALFSNPITAAVGAALLVGAFFYGRKKQRQADERQRDELFSGQQGIIPQLDRMIRDVQNHNLDGSQAVKEALSLRAQYVESIAAIKTKSVRQSAERNQLPVVDERITRLRAAANQALEDDKIDRLYVPEFAGGGFVGKFSQAEMRQILSMRRGYDDTRLIKVKAGEKFLPPHEQRRLIERGGIIPGTDRGVDDTYMRAPIGSLILNKEQQRDVQQFATGGVVGFNAYGGSLAASSALFNAYAGSLAASVAQFNAYTSQKPGAGFDTGFALTPKVARPKITPAVAPASGVGQLASSARSDEKEGKPKQPIVIKIGNLKVDLDKKQLVFEGLQAPENVELIIETVNEATLDRKIVTGPR